MRDHRGLILAAGRGARMREWTAERPKCLFEFRGRPLLLWQMEAMRKAGIDQVGIVRGYRGEMLQPFGTAFFDNRRWAETNMVRSLMSAAAWLAESPCIVSYSDIFYPPDVVGLLAGETAGLAITYDLHWLALWKRRFADPLADAETFRIDEESWVVDIGGKAQRLDEIQGQYMGLLRITPEAWAQTAAFLGKQDPAEVDRMDMTTLLRLLIADGVRVKAVPTAAEWGEIDQASDLAAYEDKCS